MLQQFRDGQKSDLSKIDLKELAPNELQWLLSKIENDLSQFYLANQKANPNTQSLLYEHSKTQRQEYIDTQAVNPVLMRQLSAILEGGLHSK